MQGFAVLQRASDAFDWHLDLASIARMWRADVSFVVYSSTILLPLSKHPINLSTCCWLLISGKKSRRCFPVGRVSLQKR